MYVILIIAHNNNFVNPLVCNFIKGSVIMCNQDIRNEVLGSGMKLWQVAQELGITDSSFSRKLRKELSDSEKAKVRAIIAKNGKTEGQNDR